jgi:hypothetical protein
LLIPVRLTVCWPEFSTIDWSAIGLNVGAWLTGRTVTVKLWKTVSMPPLAVPPLSLTVTVITAEPLTFCAGWKLSVAFVASAAG